MNKFLTALCAAAITFSAAATEPNRVIINHTDGSTSAYMVDRIENITFGTVDGIVKAECEVIDVMPELSMIYVSVTGTPDCVSWKYVAEPTNVLAQYDTDDKLASHINASLDFTIREFPEYGGLRVDDMRPGVEYQFCTLAFDRYDTPCYVCRSTFTPEVEITGKPDVEVTVTDITETSAKITMTPNDDCLSFAYYLDVKGMLQNYYEQLGSVGVGSLEETVEMISFERPTEEVILTPDYLSRATEYELNIVCYDLEGTKSPLKTVRFTTSGAGTGAAWVDITPTKFAINQMPNPDNIYEILFVPFMYFRFTPNADTARFRQEMFTKAEFEAIGEEAAIAKVRTEPSSDVPDDMWFRYEECEMRSHFDPETEIVVIAAGKNATGEWGEANILHYTTPAEVEQ